MSQERKNDIRLIHIYTALILIGIMVSCSKKSEKAIPANTTGESWMMLPFEKHDSLFPILKSDSSTFFCPVSKTNVKWQETFVFNPAAIVSNGKVYLLFRGEDKIGKFGGTSRIGIAESNDGFHFTKSPQPVIFPDNDAFLDYEKDGGCEDPRIVESEDGTYIITYTAYNGVLARLCIATSKDLLKWEKQGLAFGKAKNGIYTDLWSKSGAIICKRVGNKMIATRINGKYWMYWGETDIYLATSDNLIDWVPVLKEEKTGKRFASYLGKGQYDIRFDEPKYYFKTAVEIREGRFDSQLVEPGPPPFLTNDGIFFMYNGSNDGIKGDSTLKPGEYTVGQVMFDAKDPSSIIKRCDNYFLKAERKNETSGQIDNTAFVEALVHFNNTWFIYYTMAEAGIGVATCEKPMD